jgi:hypothetical protein
MARQANRNDDPAPGPIQNIENNPMQRRLAGAGLNEFAKTF